MTKPVINWKALVAGTGIRTHFGRDADLKTTVKLRVIGRQQQLLRLDFENTPKTEVLASQTATFAKLLPEHDAVLFSDYGKGGLAHVSDMIARARAAGKPILIDPKGTTIHATKMPASSRPTAPSCSRSLAPGWTNPSCRPNARTCASSSAGCRAADPQRRRHDAV